MLLLSSCKPAKALLSLGRLVSSGPLGVRRFFHVLALVLATTLGQGPTPAWGQSSPEAPAPAAALEARSEDGASTLLPLLGETLRARIDDGHATANYTHVFQNESSVRVEGNYRLLVGEGATATGFAYYNGEEKIVGEIFERQDAQEVYDALTGLKRDPGLLEQSGEGGFAFHVFPIEPGEKKRVEVATSRWL